MEMVPPSRSQSGLTIIELMVVLAIGAVLAMVAAPSFQSVMRNMRQSSAMNLLMNDMNMARSEAIKRNVRVLVCARDASGTGCGTQWASGWVVCVQSAVSNQCALSTADTPNPLVVRPPLDPSLTLSAVAEAGHAVPVLRFSPDSSQSSETVEGVRDLAVTFTVGGTWSGATARAVEAQRTGNIAKK